MTVPSAAPRDVILDIILSHSITRNDASALIERLKNFYEYAYFEQHSQTTDFSQQLASYITTKSINPAEAAFLRSLTDMHTGITATTLYQILDDVSRELESLPLITLYVPVQISTEYMTSIRDWLKQHIHPRILVSLIIDPTYLGGCGISWNGSFKDYSLAELQDQQTQYISQILQEMEKSSTA